MEREDFAAGTSSRSTKLLHGGVRYLEKAFWKLDYGQLKLVFEALHERKTLLDIAPHLCHPLPIMTVSQTFCTGFESQLAITTYRSALSPLALPVQPCYKWWEVPYYWAGLKVSLDKECTCW